MTVNLTYKKWFNDVVNSGDRVNAFVKSSECAFNKTLCDCINDNWVSQILKLIENFDFFQNVMLYYFGVMVTPENYRDFLFETINRFEKEGFSFDS